jgi:hypothetical protein
LTPHTAPAQDLQPVSFLATPGPAATKAMNTELIAAFGPRHDNPRRTFDGVPLLLLTTTDARNGIPRTTLRQAPGLARPPDGSFMALAERARPH